MTRANLVALRLLLVVGFLTGVTMLSGCVEPYGQAMDGGLEQPPDFSIELRVQGKNQAENRQQQTAYYVVLPNRRLYFSIGAAATSERFPISYIVLTHDQFGELVNIVKTNSLHTEPTSPNVDTADVNVDGTSIYHVAITAWGRSNRYKTLAIDSPPTLELLQAIIDSTTQGSGQAGDVAP